ncbi:MAG: preprotein translocase subunit SecG [Sediminicola sp.]|jgi:preprotein translocase subunit SecG
MIVAFLLIVVIMVQNPKGGGLSSSFGGGGTQQMGGVQKTTDFLDKSTWTLGGLMIGLILLSSIPLMGNDANQSKAFDGDVIENVIPTTTETPAGTSGDSENNGGGQ